MTRIIQITDPHLGPEKSYQLAGVQTFNTFDAVVKDALACNPDLFLITGDIGAHPDLAAYKLFFDYINATGVPMVWLPGNHDVVDIIEAAQGAKPYKKFHDIGSWRIFLMDSVLEDSPNGCFSQGELELLERLLTENTQEHALVCMHHHPMAVGSEWLDNQCISNGDQVLEIIQANDKVRGVHWGHIHQAFEEVRDGILYASAPSTCIQFKPKSTHFALEGELPGFRILDLNELGEIETEVRRVEVEDFSVELEIQGY